MSRETLPALEDVFAASFEREQTLIRTIVPGSVTAFSRNPRECSVRIDMLAQLRNGDSAEIPPIDRVPIVWPCGGGFAMDADLAIDEQVLVLVCDRDISGWLPAGGLVDPPRRLLHDVTNAIALVGLRSINRQSKIQPAPGELVLGADTGNPPWVKLGTLPPSVTMEAPVISLGEGATPLQGAARVGDPVTVPALEPNPPFGPNPWLLWFDALAAFSSTTALLAAAKLVPIGTIFSGSTKTRIE